MNGDITKVKDIPELIGNLEIEPILSEINRGMWTIAITVLIGGCLVLLVSWLLTKIKL